MDQTFNSKNKRFSIDDAFQEDEDEIIKVYGSVTERSPLKVKAGIFPSEFNFKFQDGISHDSDLYSQDNFVGGLRGEETSCWHHPKVKENWKMVLAAILLFVIGTGLLTAGVVLLFLPELGIQSMVFFVTGIICFVPGVYHITYIYLAVKGCQGYDFYHLPIFN